MKPEHSSQSSPKAEELKLPVEVEIYIDPDGSVVFADLEQKVIPIARRLNPGNELVAGAKPLAKDAVETGRKSTKTAPGK